MTSTLLLEVGCEELPTSFLEDAMGQLGKLIPEELARAGVGFGAVRAMGTPRRVAVVVEGVAAEIAPREEELLGPPASAAVDAQGAWTRAAEGFAKKNDLPLEALSLVDTPKGRYLRAIKRTPGATSLSLLPAALTAALRRVSFAKSMRWARQETAFGRPIQWIVALLDDAVVPLSFAGVEAGRVSYGHRFLAPEPIALAHASGYEAALTAAKVQADATARREAVLQALLASATAEGGTLRRDAFLEGRSRASWSGPPWWWGASTRASSTCPTRSSRA
jgi:glycyl-tRNA synthetase beta chain